MVLKSSTAYNREKEGIAINNKIRHGVKVQIISNTVLCLHLVGNTTLEILLNTSTFSFSLFSENKEKKLKTSDLPTEKLNNKKLTKTTTQKIKNIIS
jgi:hypothetical protein